MKSGLLTAIVLLAVFCAASSGALNAYLYLEGEQTGKIEGSVTQKGREGSIMVIAFDHLITSPRDAASGMPTGKRQHMPIRITKEIDKSTPLLLRAFTDNDRLHGEIRFWQPTPSGLEEQYYTIRFAGAYITTIHQEMLNNKYPENMQHKEREEISIAYTTIEKVFNDGGISAEARWEWVPGYSVRVSDLNFDGVVNVLDLSVLAGEWMETAQ